MLVLSRACPHVPLPDRGASASAAYKDRLTPLLFASVKGYEAVARLLLDRGASASTADKDGSTPLTWASMNGHEAVARLLPKGNRATTLCPFPEARSSGVDPSLSAVEADAPLSSNSRATATYFSTVLTAN
jgi:ankyrin repeat protein